VGEGPIAAVQEQATGGLSTGSSGTGAPPIEYVDLFVKSPSGWSPLADFSRLPSGQALSGVEGQTVEAFAAVDFEGQGKESLAIAVLSFGASTGPLRLRILSFRGTDIALDLEEDTRSDGTVVVDGRTLVLETGSYGPGDPHCCPSGVIHQRIGWSAAHKKVEVLEQTITPLPTSR
jgi:hypothetical protein